MLFNSFQQILSLLEDWAKKNGIDLQYLFGGFGGMKSMRGGWMLFYI